MTFWNALSIGLFLLPQAIGFVARARPEREPWRAALDVPVIMALDLLTVLLLARVVTLELATFISRGAWLAAGSAIVYRRRRVTLAWLRGVDLRAWVGPILCAAAALWLSSLITLSCGIWDRYWHIPLTASMRGQSTPFFNVYEPAGRLYYHYAGDALAAMLQSLSFAHLHSSSALSRVHDIVFGLFGFTMAGLLPVFGLKRIVWSLLATTATLLSGPATVLIEEVSRPAVGRSIINLLSLSHRPHTAVAYLMMLGFAAALLAPVIARTPIRARDTRGALFLCTAALMLSDETSLFLLGLMLAVVWLWAPGSLAEARKHGLLVGAGLLATLAAVVLMYGGSFAPGAPRPLVQIASEFRVPGFMQAPAALGTALGRKLFVADFWGCLVIWLAGAVALATNRTRAVAAVFTGYSVITLVGLLALTRLDINGGGTECHRFATAPLFLAPLLGLYFASRPGINWRFERSRSLVGLLTGLGIALPAVSSTEWLFGLKKSTCEKLGMELYSGTDCWSAAAARPGQRPVMAYADQNQWYAIAGCRPLRAPSSQQDLAGHATPTGWPQTGWEGVRKLDGWIGDAPLTAFCSAQSTDAVCRRLGREQGSCRSLNRSLQRCTMSAELRRALLANGGK